LIPQSRPITAVSLSAPGDGSNVEFRSVVDAVRCAIEVQTGMVERNAGLPPEKRIEFRVGVHVGDVVEESDGDLMGDGVNIATRLEGVAKPGFQTPSPNARVRRGGLGSRIGDRLPVGDRLAERRAQRRFIVT
jgi:hypothetical protein